MAARSRRGGVLLLLVAGVGSFGCGGEGSGSSKGLPPAVDGSAGPGMNLDAGTGGTIGDPDAAGASAGGDGPRADASAPQDTGGDAAAAPVDRPAPPDAAPASTFPPEIDGRIVINEIMASNGLTLKNEAGLAGDWIELHNPTDRPVPLAGYALTDDFNVPAKAVIPAGVVLPARGHLLLWLDGAADRGPTHLPLRLASEGGSLGLARPDGSFISRLVYGAQATDFSAAREPDGSDRWTIEWHPSPGSANPAGTGRPLGLPGAGAPPEQVPAAGDLSETLLGAQALPELGITVDADGVSRLLANPTTYVPATLVFQGRSYGPVGLRLKGSASFEPFDRKPSLRINVDEYVPDAEFFGLKDLTLNNMHSDQSMMHERLGYWIARQAGLPASRSSHALVSINGQPAALYANVETVKRRMLKRWFNNPDGALYEATEVDFTTTNALYPHSDGRPRDDIPLYELKGKVDDRSLLYALAQALTLPSPDAAMAAAANHLNVAEFHTFWAVTAIMGNFDVMPYSVPGDDYFVYANPEDRKLYLMPWGIDETFEAGDIDIVNTVYSVLAKTCAASRACLQQFVDRVWAILDKLEAMDWQGERVRIAQQIAPHTVRDVRKPYTDAQVAEQQENMKYFIRERRMTLGRFIPPPAAP
jgi:spore coat protein H